MPTVFEQMNEIRREGVGGADANAATVANAIKQEMNADESAQAEPSKYSDTCPGNLAANKWFEGVTILVICLNALWLGYDAEYTATIGKPDDLYQGPVHIIVVEQLFAVFFTFEIIVRLVGTRLKAGLIWDGWFVFDSLLVTLMVLEIWILPLAGGGLPGFGILRLLRLLRITRMAKLMRAVPEIMTIVTGLGTSVKAVSSVAVLLFLITYTFAIIFTSRYHQGLVLDGEEEDLATVNFGSMGKSFFSLIIMGAIFDDLTYCTDSIRSTNSSIMLATFVCYMLLSGFVMLNMLVGILAEVVCATSDGDKAQRMIDDLKEIIVKMAQEADEDGDAHISSKEFQMMLKTDSVQDMLKAVNITLDDFEKLGEFAFAHFEGEKGVESVGVGEEVSMTYDDLVDLICRIRPDVKFGALQFSTFQGAMSKLLRITSNGLAELDELSARAAAKLLQLPPATDAESTASKDGEPLPAQPQGPPPASQNRAAVAEQLPARADLPTSVSDERWAQINSMDLIEELRRRVCEPSSARPVPSELRGEAEALPLSSRLPCANATPAAPRLPSASPRPDEDRTAAAARPPRPQLLAPIPGLDGRFNTEELQKSSSRTADTPLPPVLPAEGTAVSAVVQRPSSALRSRRPSNTEELQKSSSRTADAPLPPVLPAEGTAVSAVVQRPSSALRSRRPSPAPRSESKDSAPVSPAPGPRPSTPAGAPPSIAVETAPAQEVRPDGLPEPADVLLSTCTADWNKTHEAVDAAPAQEVRPEGLPESADVPFAPFGVPDPDVN